MMATQTPLNITFIRTFTCLLHFVLITKFFMQYIVRTTDRIVK